MTFTEHKLLSMDVHSSEAFKQGGRRGAKKVMIVITDGESHDSADLQQVIEDSEKDGITRYAIAVSIVFLNFFFFFAVALIKCPFSCWNYEVAHFKMGVGPTIEVTFSCCHQWKRPNAFSPIYEDLWIIMWAWALETNASCSGWLILVVVPHNRYWATTTAEASTQKLSSMR